MPPINRGKFYEQYMVILTATILYGLRSKKRIYFMLYEQYISGDCMCHYNNKCPTGNGLES